MKIVRLILSVLAGIVLGSITNMALVNLGPSVIPLPEGADVSTTEGLALAMSLFEPKHFLFPFLGHALGTLVGAFLAKKLSGFNSGLPAYIIGFFFLAGGLIMIAMVPSPLWFTIADLGLAYLPMAWLAKRLA